MATRKKALAAMKAKVSELQEFVIWMTGYGYDFCQHDYFCEQRDRLLKGHGKELQEKPEHVLQDKHSSTT